MSGGPLETPAAGGRALRLRRRTSAASILTLLALCAGLALTGCDTPVEAVVLRVTHRMYPNFKEELRVVPGTKFQIGDTDYHGRIVGFVPDFVIDSKTMKVSSRSDSVRNPAFHLEVFEADSLVERTWAFMKGSPPHFSRSSMLAFEVERIIWKPGQAPADTASAFDSTATAR
jgi:hypothetical protein